MLQTEKSVRLCLYSWWFIWGLIFGSVSRGGTSHTISIPLLHHEMLPKIPPKLPARQAKYCTSLHSFSKIKVIISKKSICFQEIIKLFSNHQLTWQVSIHSLVTAIYLSAADHYLQCININCTVVLFSA